MVVVVVFVVVADIDIVGFVAPLAGGAKCRKRKKEKKRMGKTEEEASSSLADGIETLEIFV